jgi:hypothetical protein
MKNKEHLTEEGLNKIIALKSAINKGLSDMLKAAFPNVVPVVRPIHTVSETPLHPSWVSGFTPPPLYRGAWPQNPPWKGKGGGVSQGGGPDAHGEGCFSLSISKRNQVLAIFKIEVHEREKHLIRKIIEFFGDLCNINFPLSRRIVRFTMTRQKHLIDVIIPHFDTYKLEGNKLDNYLI